MISRLASTILLAIPFGFGCASSSSIVRVPLEDLKRDPEWVVLDGVPMIPQHGDFASGAAALAMVLQYIGESASIDQVLEEVGGYDGQSIRPSALRDMARRRGLEAFLFSGRERHLASELRRGQPIIVGLARANAKGGTSHYEVVAGYNAVKRMVLTVDPSQGWRASASETFQLEWARTKQLALIILPRRKSAPAEAGLAAETRSFGLVPGSGEVLVAKSSGPVFRR
jgi:ABC-type bacteriocin/lantibiotic exporter with double-glycine peptidase domain